LKAAAPPGRARETTAGAIERFLLHRWSNIEIDRQACPDGTTRVREPDHVIPGCHARNVADHDRVAEPIRHLGKTDGPTAIAVIPNPAMIGPAAPADARRRAVRPRKG